MNRNSRLAIAVLGATIGALALAGPAQATGGDGCKPVKDYTSKTSWHWGWHCPPGWPTPTVPVPTGTTAPTPTATVPTGTPATTLPTPTATVPTGTTAPTPTVTPPTGTPGTTVPTTTPTTVPTTNPTTSVPTTTPTASPSTSPSVFVPVGNMGDTLPLTGPGGVFILIGLGSMVAAAGVALYMLARRRKVGFTA